MPSYIDLHTHTNASDGAMPPFELVFCAARAGLRAIAITDHDTVSGLDEGIAAGEDVGVEVIAGIELSANYPREMHILGLFIDHHSPALTNKLESLKQYRAERNAKMIDNLASQGFIISYDDVLAFKPGSTLAGIGRIHMALALTKKGYAGSVSEAFSKFLTGGAASYVARQKFEPQECIKIIKDAGGYAFLAHPIYSEKEPQNLESLIVRLKDCGLDGVECMHSEQDEAFSDICLRLCRKYSLMVSGGSDFHGANKPHIQIGQVNGQRYIEAHVLDDIKRQIFGG